MIDVQSFLKELQGDAVGYREANRQPTAPDEQTVANGKTRRIVEEVHKPKALTPKPDNIPAEFKKLKQWVCWNYKPKKDRRTGR